MQINLDEAVAKFLKTCETSHDELFKACQQAHMSGRRGTDCKSDYIVGCLTIAAFMHHQAAINLEVEGMSPEGAHSCVSDIFAKMLYAVKRNGTVSLAYTKEGVPVSMPVGEAGHA